MATVNIDYDELEGGRVATVTIDRPEKMNALDSSMIDQLNGAFRSLAKGSNLRAVILNGAGDRAWVGGADIQEMASPAKLRSQRDLCQD